MKEKWKGMFCRDSLYIVAAIQLLMLFILPPMDGKTSILRTIIYFLFAALSVAAVLIYFKRKILTKKIEYNGIFMCVMSFFLLCLISGVWGFTRGIPISDIVRGVIPFVWLIYIIILSQGLDRRQVNKLLYILSVVAVLYAMRILIYYFIYVAGRPEERVTFHLVQATSMMPMLGSMLLGYFFIKNEKKNIALLGLSLICYIATILTATKSMLLALIGGWIIFGVLLFAICRKQFHKHAFLKKNLFVMLISLAICTALLLGVTNLGSRWKNMISISQGDTNQGDTNQGDAASNGNHKVVVVDQGSVTVRIIEIKTAISNFKESPILGKGLGYRWTAKGIDYGGAVIYMHNIVAYFLMDFGLLGILFMCIILGMLFVRIRKVWRSRADSYEDKTAFLLIVSILAMAFMYANFFAIFRSIEYVFVCALLFAALELTGKEIVNGEHE